MNKFVKLLIIGLVSFVASIIITAFLPVPLGIADYEGYLIFTVIATFLVLFAAVSAVYFILLNKILKKKK